MKKKDILEINSELLEALKLARAYIGKGIADGAFQNCVVSAGRALIKIEHAISRADGSFPATLEEMDATTRGEYTP